MGEQEKAAVLDGRRANLVVVRGRLDGEVNERLLRSGDRVADLSVRAAPGDGSVPVVWPDAPAAVHDLADGDEVLVVGRVRRRFFRAGGAVQSRTEVLADSVTPTRRAARVRAALVDAAARLAELS